MKQSIKDVLEDIADSQPNLHSEAAREMIANLITAALKDKGEYKEFTEEYIEALEAKETWVCSICGKNTYDVDYDYIGTGTNHLGCELDRESEDMPEGLKEAKRLSHEALEEGLRREKNSSQKKHEEKVFGHDQGGNYESTDTMTGHDHGNVWQGSDTIQKQVYMEMTSDGLPPGGDTQAVLESHKLADEIVDNQEGKWIYESPDGGKTVFRRPFSDYDPENKEEIDWETKKPTGRKFTEYPFKTEKI